MCVKYLVGSEGHQDADRLLCRPDSKLPGIRVVFCSDSSLPDVVAHDHFSLTQNKRHGTGSLHKHSNSLHTPHPQNTAYMHPFYHLPTISQSGGNFPLSTSQMENSMLNSMLNSNLAWTAEAWAWGKPNTTKTNSDPERKTDRVLRQKQSSPELLSLQSWCCDRGAERLYLLRGSVQQTPIPQRLVPSWVLIITGVGGQTHLRWYKV